MGSTAGHWRFAPATCSLKRSSSLNGSKRINMACSSLPFLGSGCWSGLFGKECTP